jgi:hypothetical protein
MTAGEICIEEDIGLYCRRRRFTRYYELDFPPLAGQKEVYPHLIGVGEYTAVSDAMTSASSWGLFNLVSLLGLALSVVEPPSLLGEFDFFSSFSLFSKPSTLFKRASKTSVFGPRFFGTASNVWSVYMFVHHPKPRRQ